MFGVGYEPVPFRSGQVEMHLDEMRSIVATYLFRQCIQDLQVRGQDFASHLVVPQVTQELPDGPTKKLENRADHNHLLKRIATSTREGRDQSLDLDAFDEVLASKDCGMIMTTISPS